MSTLNVDSMMSSVAASTGTLGSLVAAVTPSISNFLATAPASPGSPAPVASVKVEVEKPHPLFSIFGNLITLIALYLAFKCKAPGGGIDFIQLFIAFLCSPCYIVYRLAQPCA